jgi:microsomal dipeptidase-like Zn-dependent dipeptidase
MLAVSNEALCKSGTKVSGEDCTLSMNDIDNQLQAAQSFQTWLDAQYGGAGKGWFQIVHNPNEATSVIQQGKLAVVLGIEVDNIFNCHFTDANGNPLNGEGPVCNATYLTQQLQKYYGMGVRHIFPIHDFDNAFGPTATWQDAINAGQVVGEGGFQNAANCTDPGYGFSFDAFTDSAILLAAFGILKAPDYPTFTSGSCSNNPGLTTLGNNLIQQAMSMGFIIDVDHMSISGFNLTIDMATQQSPVYAGISASHVQFFDLYEQNYPNTGHYGRHERMRTYSQLQRIANAGGMIGVMLKDDAQDTGNGWCLPGGNCPFGSLNLTGPDFTLNYNGSNAPSNNNGALNQNCLYSTTETALQYLYGAQAMNGAGGVALGSDFMGIAGHVGPRFGNGACGGHADQRAAQLVANKPLAYPFTLAGFGTFDKQVSGQKTYDFNVDGLAHIGLLPDMVADMKNVGVTDQQLQPLFGSAQAYINMWSVVYKAPAPNVSVSGVPATAAYQSTFTVATNNNQTTTSVPSIAAGPSNVCSVSGAVVTMASGTGTCSVTATWAADANYAAASITKTVTATTISPKVAFTGAPATDGYASSFTVSATTNASTAAVITASPGSVCSISGTTVTMTSGTGTCSLTATWAADSNYNSASLSQTTTAAKISPSATFTGAPATDPYASSFPVSATTKASTAAVIAASAGSVCSISGLTVTMTSGTGTCSLTATWAADSNYSSASLTQTTTATKVPLTVTANNAAMTFGQAIPTFAASYSGFVNSQTQSVLSGSASLTTTATQFSAPGTYTITAALGTLASANYSFLTFKNGTLTISATATVPPSGTACNGAYQGGTFTGNITVTPNQICEIDGGVVNGNVTSTGGVVILLGGTTVTGSVNISGKATGSDATVPLQVCGATVKSNLLIQTDSSAITLGGTSCGATKVGGNLIVKSDSGAVSITSTSVTGNMTVQGNTGTVLVSGNTVGGNMQVQNNTDAATNATQVMNNHVSQNLVCSGNTSITGQGNTAKSKQGQCATF